MHAYVKIVILIILLKGINQLKQWWDSYHGTQAMAHPSINN